MDCQHLDDLYELFLLGIAGEEEGAAEIGEHLGRGCPYCRERLREATQVVYSLAQNLRPLRPIRLDQKARAGLLRRARKVIPGA